MSLKYFDIESSDTIFINVEDLKVLPTYNIFDTNSTNYKSDNSNKKNMTKCSKQMLLKYDGLFSEKEKVDNNTISKIQNTSICIHDEFNYTLYRSGTVSKGFSFLFENAYYSELLKKYPSLYLEFYSPKLTLQTNLKVPYKKIWEFQIFSFFPNTYSYNRINMKKKTFEIQKPVFLFEDYDKVNSDQYEAISRENMLNLFFDFSNSKYNKVYFYLIGL